MEPTNKKQEKPKKPEPTAEELEKKPWLRPKQIPHKVEPVLSFPKAAGERAGVVRVMRFFSKGVAIAELAKFANARGVKLHRTQLGLLRNGLRLPSAREAILIGEWAECDPKMVFIAAGRVVSARAKRLAAGHPMGNVKGNKINQPIIRSDQIPKEDSNEN